MTSLGFDYPWVLLLLGLCVMPLLGLGPRWWPSPSLIGIPRDRVSEGAEIGLRLLAALSMALLVLALGGLHRRDGIVTRTGKGAHVVLLIDRSVSMDQTFDDREPTAKQESKTAAAVRLIQKFFAGRPHDQFAVVAFSTSPILALPLTEHRAAVAAALGAMKRPALGKTDIGRGLGLALAQFGPDTTQAQNVVLFVSDGAGVIDREVKDKIRADALRTHLHLYYLYLRTKGDPGLFEKMDTADASAPASLNQYFSELGVPYRAFEAEDPSAVARAIEQIDRLEVHPIRYHEHVLRRDYAPLLYALALGCGVLVALALLAERGLAEGGS
ncbi:vWA domain-containing protein [Acidomonas methanolica]|uniref:vWA domain-containing protein n=1 Tax=Acidomonas methanolica TaxID=437 RepID=UPI00211A7A81|nr:vWA domain-containing protein [Acidomonas methanolica]MCQ9155746.1 VWA domain-containing protein [Acidomonas methanolica]